MFRVENNVPDVYIQESRDFQLISRLYDLVFQSTRYSIDSMESATSTSYCIDTLLPLIATKVGFFEELRIPDEMYRKVLAAFPYIMRFKGSKQGIQLIVNLFQRLVNTTVELQENVVTGDLTIVFERYSPHAQLLYTLLEYVRPTGMFISYKVIVRIKGESDYTTNDTVEIRPKMKETSLVPPSGVVAQYMFNNTDNYDVENASTIGFTQVADPNFDVQENE